MANINRICKYYSRGECLKGEQCDYSHDQERRDTSGDICKFYQRGYCAYGSRCRYKHVKAFQEQTPASSSENRSLSLISNSRTAHTDKGKSSWVPKAATTLMSPFDNNARNLQQKKQHSKVAGGGDVGESSYSKPSSEPLFCAFSAANCPKKDKCSSIHGDQCLYCRKHCLHPVNQNQRKNHLKTCENKVEALKNSQEVECSICLEHVLQKPKLAERKFGLLPECDHAFCLSCIRNWRNTAPSNSFPTIGMNITDADPVRTCPVCRKLSSFVIPSDIWFSTEEEKLAIMDNYKTNCKLIDCKYFNFGYGNCPFGTSCFYKHTVKPGSYKGKHSRRPTEHRTTNKFNMYDTIGMLSECDLTTAEMYSIMNDMEFFDGMDPFERLGLAETLGNDHDDDEGVNYFHMGGLPEALLFDGLDDYDDSEYYDYEGWVPNPMEAAILSIMMNDNADDNEEEDNEEDEEECSDSSDEDY